MLAKCSLKIHQKPYLKYSLAQTTTIVMVMKHFMFTRSVDEVKPRASVILVGVAFSGSMQSCCGVRCKIRVSYSIETREYTYAFDYKLKNL